MDELGLFWGTFFSLLAGTLGVLTSWAGWRMLRDARALRRRGAWVAGVIERRIAPGGPFGVYRFIDLDGMTRFANMSWGRVPDAPTTVVQIRLDPLDRISPRHRRRGGGALELAGAVMLMLFGIVWCAVLVAMIYSAVTAPGFFCVQVCSSTGSY
jgi:hypothetical protein